MTNSIEQTSPYIKKPFYKRRYTIFWIIWLLVISIIYIYLQTVTLSWSIVQVEWIAMSPTINSWDIVLLNRKFKSVQRWDIIVFVPKWRSVSYIKRIIGLPWETVTIKESKITICKNENCTVINEDYLWNPLTLTKNCNKNVFSLKKGYFVLWDNRETSTDSRCCFWLTCETNKSYEVMLDEILWVVKWKK